MCARGASKTTDEKERQRELGREIIIEGERERLIEGQRARETERGNGDRGNAKEREEERARANTKHAHPKLSFSVFLCSHTFLDRTATEAPAAAGEEEGDVVVLSSQSDGGGDDEKGAGGGGGGDDGGGGGGGGGERPSNRTPELDENRGGAKRDLLGGVLNALGDQHGKRARREAAGGSGTTGGGDGGGFGGASGRGGDSNTHLGARAAAPGFEMSAALQNYFRVDEGIPAAAGKLARKEADLEAARGHTSRLEADPEILLAFAISPAGGGIGLPAGGGGGGGGGGRGGRGERLGGGGERLVGGRGGGGGGGGHGNDHQGPRDDFDAAQAVQAGLFRTFCSTPVSQNALRNIRTKVRGSGGSSVAAAPRLSPAEKGGGSST